MARLPLAVSPRVEFAARLPFQSVDLDPQHSRALARCRADRGEEQYDSKRRCASELHHRRRRRFARHSAMPPKIPAWLETIFAFLSSLNAMKRALPPPIYSLS
jgi:hypothetical protein